jgi:hypothetical protein
LCWLINALGAVGGIYGKGSQLYKLLHSGAVGSKLLLEAPPGLIDTRFDIVLHGMTLTLSLSRLLFHA